MGRPGLLPALAGLALAVLAGIPAAAQDTRNWGEVRGWTIAVDPSLNNSCFALNEYDDGTVLRIGLDMSDPEGRWYIMFGNDAWRSIEENGEYDVALQFDREAEWTAVASGDNMGGETNFLYVFGSDIDFFDEFIRKNTLTLSYAGQSIAKVSLAGSARATGVMLDCQDHQTTAPAADPFASKKSKAKADPFGN